LRVHCGKRQAILTVQPDGLRTQSRKAGRRRKTALPDFPWDSALTNAKPNGFDLEFTKAGIEEDEVGPDGEGGQGGDRAGRAQEQGERI
jgi:hypothetical protein